MLINVEQAIINLKEQKIIAYPTEAVYGLGCDASNTELVHKVIELKKRDENKGVIILGSIIEHVLPFLGHLEDSLLEKVMETWPGPVTWILPSAHNNVITGYRDRIAVRISSHPVVLALCEGIGGSIVSTSANFEGKPPAIDYKSVVEYFPQVPVVKGDLGGLDKPTRIIDSQSNIVIRD